MSTLKISMTRICETKVGAARAISVCARKFVRAGAVALLATLAVLLSVPSPARAQGGIGDIVYTVGTVTRDGFGRDWAYILWQATDPSLISNRVFAVYAKVGDATNNAPYERKSIVMLQTDARVIEPLLRRAENLGNDQNKLQEDLQQLFSNLMPSNTISRSERLSAVIRGSLNDAKHYQNLLLLARNHAGINLALGFADAQLIGPGLTTFEVRAYDMVNDKDLAVIGRVTVEANNPTVLPQPGPPVLVPEYTAMGDLNIKLRWGTPDELRRLGLMQFGYNLYRVQRSFAASQGWSAAVRPPLSALLSLSSNNPAAVKRVNRVPIVPPKVFTLAEAANFTPPGDTNMMFIMDDDGRGRPGYVNYGWTNGAEYIYYVSGRDVLGRDGALSFGLVAKVCDELPPVPPRSVSVVNDYSYNTNTMASNQWLRVTWKQAPNTNDNVTNYWIYRWTSITQMNNLSGGISNHLIAVVPHVPNATYNSYVDNNSPSSPNTTNDMGKTYWYTVRAGDAGACGQNLSGPGGPAYGVLRDRIGPDGGGGFIQINCVRPRVRHVGNQLIQTNDSDNSVMPFLLRCQRIDPRFEWVEFIALVNYSNGSSNQVVSNYFGRIYFLNDEAVSTWWTPLRTPGGQFFPTAVLIGCRAGTFGGKISNLAVAPVSALPLERNFAVVNFEAFTQTSRVVAGDRKDDDCREHDPGGGSGGPSGTNEIGVVVFPTPGSKEYRIYRRVDDGPLSMICQGAITNIFAAIECLENAPPVNGGTICFYVQLLDEHGNPSPMTLLGCVDTAPVSPLPVPVLTKIAPTGDESNPGMTLSWFCPPYGVERFELRIAGLPVPPLTNNYDLSPELSFTAEPASSMTFSNFGTNLTLSFYPFITAKVGPGFGNNGATFLVPGNVELGKTYIVTVRALGKNGNASGFSNFETFVWNPTNGPNPNVPWPARGVPSTNANLAALAFFLAPTNPPALQGMRYGNAVLLGFTVLTNQSVDRNQNVVYVGGSFNPMAVLATNALGQTLFPSVMYRYQVPNANFPTVSGDVIQVSPLMENIAYQANANSTAIHDPFIETSVVSLTDNFLILYLWLRDTQPQISGARYRYVLVRFKENQEIDQLIQSNEVEVP